MTALAGCAGRTLEGRWLGRMPLAGAENCQVKLSKKGIFEFACAAPGNWVGQGTFFYDGHRLRLDYQVVARPDGTKRTSPAPVSMRVEGSTGNILKLETQDGGKFEWKREVN